MNRKHYTGSLGLNGHRDSYEHAQEKEPEHGPRVTAPRYEQKQPANWQCADCGGFGPLDCSCVCRDCGAHTQTRINERCLICHDVHQAKVARELHESIEQAAWLEAQLAMEAV